jgi:hypothetical protein
MIQRLGIRKSLVAPLRFLVDIRGSSSDYIGQAYSSIAAAGQEWCQAIVVRNATYTCTAGTYSHGRCEQRIIVVARTLLRSIANIS